MYSNTREHKAHSTQQWPTRSRTRHTAARPRHSSSRLPAKATLILSKQQQRLPLALELWLLIGSWLFLLWKLLLLLLLPLLLLLLLCLFLSLLVTLLLMLLLLLLLLFTLL